MKFEIVPSARLDILDAAEELAVRFSARTARNFLERVEATTELIRIYPEAGAAIEPPIPDYPNLRARAVSKFRGRVIYWEIRGDTVRVLRILQARRDRGRVFRRSLT